MLTISKPLSAGQAQTYHKEEFANAEENYYSEGDRIRGEWHGRLAQEWGLHGEVQEEHFQRLANGQHPLTEEQLVRHQTPREYVNARGETVSTMEHRAAWDATFSAPKSVSLTALVGGDEAVRQAHRDSVKVALNEMEKFVVSRTINKVEWNAALVRGDVAEAVGELREQPGNGLLVVGSRDLVRYLQRRNLVDEYRLWIHPVIVGSGSHLFDAGLDTATWAMKDVVVTNESVAILTYVRPSGR